MDDYAGRVLADRYRLPLPPSDEYELTETRAFDTYSGQEVLVRQVPLPEVVEAEVLDAEGLPDGFTAREPRERGARRSPTRTGPRRPTDPAVRRAVEAAQAAARIPDHPRLDQVFDVFAEGGSLWIVSEFVAARPLAAFLAEKPLTPYRAAEVASDVLMALRVLHAHGWVHRNITARTVLICDDGRVMLTGLAVGAAEEALCGYDPVPAPAGDGGVGGGSGDGGGAGARGGGGGTGGHGSGGVGGTFGGPGGPGGPGGGALGRGGPGGLSGGPGGHVGIGGAQGGAAPGGMDPVAARSAAIRARSAGGLPSAETDSGQRSGGAGALAPKALASGGDVRAARAGAIAAYRAGARAAARVQEAQNGRAALPGARLAPEGGVGATGNGATQAYPAGDGGVVGQGYGSAQAHSAGDVGFGGQANGSAQAAPGGDGGLAGQGYGSAHAHPGGDGGFGGQANGSAQSAPAVDGSLGDQAYGSAQAHPAGDVGSAGQANGSALQPYAPGEGTVGPAANGTAQPYASGEGVQDARSSVTPPGQIADPYGVGGTSWHGATPRGVAGNGGAAAGATGNGPADLDTAPPTGLPGPGFGGSPAPGMPALAPEGTPALDAPSPHPSPAPEAPSSHPSPTPQPPTHWHDLVAGTPAPPPAPPRGPATALAAERARQARMAVVGPVTERWAPEQAGPVHENWQLAAPIGPATDLWALGALLFRAVQGHAPYPEESTAELVQMVCAEPPAFAEECGPLRPVVESLLRQDPTERLDFEEVRGWLRSLVRSAPEPDAGAHVVAAPPVDVSRLPVVRRRGELVRRRKAGLPATTPHGRHKRAKEQAGSPRKLGRTLLLLILLLLAGAIAYAMLFMPKAGDDSGASGEDRTGAAGQVSPAPERSDQSASSQPQPDQSSTKAADSPTPSKSAGATQTQTTDPDVGAGFTLRKDPEGFQVAVAKGWSRADKNSWNQIVYSKGDFELIVVPGRDGAVTYGSDPMAYQRDEEHELQPYRSSSWATATGLRTITVGTRTMAEGQFTWTDGSGRDLYVRNLAILIDGRYHVVQVRGPESQRDEVTKLYEQAYATYTYTG
ncbi:protein kinase [Streptomyces cylindrosporus]|uniref:Protein kinase n=1 Tax=Streptomyces cylindrosporus TaxID=2927583 RepID=A0ABS9YHQ1_9ACTN|nr:protein kinase [Streptomyces cylindrosporus]MCI3276101.1 protein kinase [Streptomyces cylindrosporus]